MSDRTKEGSNSLVDTDIDSDDLKGGPSEIADEFILIMAAGHENKEPLLSRLFSVRFEESEDYVSFFNRLFVSLRQVKPLLHELTKIEALSVYFEDEKWSSNPMVDFFQSYESPLRYVLQFENFSENPEFPIDTWRWLDYFLEKTSPIPEHVPWAGQIKDALFYAAMHCDLESESDKFMQYLDRVIEKLRPRRDVLWSHSCFEWRKKGKSRKEISEIDPWEFY